MRISLWPAAATVTFCSLFVALGFWQLWRAEQKQQQQRFYADRVREQPVSLNVLDILRRPPHELHWRRIVAYGTFAPSAELLLDNRTHRGQSGYYLYTPFQLQNENVWVLVNRGWVTAGARRDRPPPLSRPPAVPLRLAGVAAPPVLSRVIGRPAPERLAPGQHRIQALELDVARDLLGLPLLPFVIRLDASAPYGYVRAWEPPGRNPERSRGYAFQWFSFAIALSIIYVVLNLRRSPAGKSPQP